MPTDDITDALDTFREAGVPTGPWEEQGGDWFVGLDVAETGHVVYDRRDTDATPADRAMLIGFGVEWLGTKHGLYPRCLYGKDWGFVFPPEHPRAGQNTPMNYDLLAAIVAAVEAEIEKMVETRESDALRKKADDDN